MKLKILLPAIALTIAAVGIGGYQMLLAKNAAAAATVSHQPFTATAFAAAQKAEQRPFSITRQSTLIAYRGNRETGRLIAATDPAEITKLIASTR